jgi:hypothetical protein
VFEFQNRLCGVMAGFVGHLQIELLINLLRKRTAIRKGFTCSCYETSIHFINGHFKIEIF